MNVIKQMLQEHMKDPQFATELFKEDVSLAVTEAICETLNSYGFNQKVDSNREILKALRDVTDHAARNTCLHEETYRGGAIWEICSQCGMKWADDEGGKPDDAHELPEPIKRAYDVLDKYGDSPHGR